LLRAISEELMASAVALIGDACQSVGKFDTEYLKLSSTPWIVVSLVWLCEKDGRVTNKKRSGIRSFMP